MTATTTILTTKCARKACTANVGPYYTDRYNGHCSYRCNNLTNNGAKR